MKDGSSACNQLKQTNYIQRSVNLPQALEAKLRRHAIKGDNISQMPCAHKGSEREKAHRVVSNTYRGHQRVIRSTGSSDAAPSQQNIGESITPTACHHR